MKAALKKQVNKNMKNFEELDRNPITTDNE